MWTAGMLGIIILTFSIFAIVLGTQRVTFGLDIDAEHLNYIRVSTELGLARTNFANLNPSEHLAQTRAVNEVLSRLSSGGETNRFSQIFRPGNYTMNGHTTLLTGGAYRTIGNIRQQSNHRYIHITWANPQFAVARDGASANIVPATNINASNNVWQVVIMLNDVPNRVSEHRWFIKTSPASTANVDYVFTTWGNYSSLAWFVENFPFHQSAPGHGTE